MMNKKLIFATVLFVSAASWGVWTLVRGGELNKVGSNENREKQVIIPEVGGEVQQSGGLVLFYSNSCPHCKNVEKYISENGVLDKIAIDQKEVSSGNNYTQFVATARKCGMKGSGVPLLWDGSKCYAGDEPIINFLKNKLSEK